MTQSTSRSYQLSSRLLSLCLSALAGLPCLASAQQSAESSLVDALIRLQVRKGIITEVEAKQLRAEAEALARGPAQAARSATAAKPSPNVEIGLQYRIMYNAANIPGRGGSTATDAEDHEFFRQRFRLSLDVSPFENVGGFAQFEFRNAWGVGGNTGGVTSPSGVAFNRLSARGIRYGTVYYTPAEEHKLTVGILPISDRLGDTLFSAAWDFNVGGMEYLGEHNDLRYRLSYVRLVDTLGVAGVKDRDGHLVIGDLSCPVGDTTLGGHLYFLGKDAHSGLTGFLGQEAEEGWYALSASSSFGEVMANGFVAVNSGSLDGDSHTGVAVKGEASVPVGEAKLSLLGLFTTGDDAGSSMSSTFLTPQGLLGTGGYWQYTHIFAANGPSDVNDLGTEIGNGGAGLLTLQAKLDCELTESVSGQVDVGWFRATEDRNGDDDMGLEVGGMLTIGLTRFLNLELGAAGAFMGDFYGSGADDLFEVFSRLQLEF